MRIGQLSRKYDIPHQEIISFLKEIEPTSCTFHSNSKLDEATEELIARKFDFSLEESSEHQDEVREESIVEKGLSESEVPHKPETVEPVQNEMEKMLLPESQLDKSISGAEVPNPQEDEEVVIETDQLLELLESDETPIDLAKITRIKAPKKQLDGLKVVGKIELPEPKTKTEEKAEWQEKEIKPERNGRRRLVSEEELEKRRLRAKEKKEEYEARQEKRKQEKEKKRIKAIKEAHYLKKMQRTKPIQQKNKIKAKNRQTSPTEEQRPKPKTLFGKFLRWLNT